MCFALMTVCPPSSLRPFYMVAFSCRGGSYLITGPLRLVVDYEEMDPMSGLPPLQVRQDGS